MCWGFDFDDGWFDLMDVLCANTASCYRRTGSRLPCRQREIQTIAILCEWRRRVRLESNLGCQCTQRRNPEQCGKPALLSRGQGWISTRCLEHGGPTFSKSILKDSEQVFNLPAIKNPCWQRLAQVFEDICWERYSTQRNAGDFRRQVIETDRLEFPLAWRRRRKAARLRFSVWLNRIRRGCGGNERRPALPRF